MFGSDMLTQSTLASVTDEASTEVPAFGMATPKMNEVKRRRCRTTMSSPDCPAHSACAKWGLPSPGGGSHGNPESIINLY
jgi:hypothetical protein